MYPGSEKYDDPRKLIKNNPENGESQVTRWFQNERQKNGKYTDNLDATTDGLFKSAIVKHPGCH